MLERLERELMLVARCNLLTPRDRKGRGVQSAQGGPSKQGGQNSQGTPAGQTGQCSGDRLDRSAYFLLSFLDTEGALSIGQLADAMGLDVSTVNRQTGALLRAGLLERIPDPQGGLARKLRATSLGAERLAADRERRRAGLARVLAGWTPEEVRRFEDALTRFNREVEADEGRSWPRPEAAPVPGAESRGRERR
ncbi:MarR family winged helix-turn-helix transcriptional regulator [Streptomyces sp. ME19-01-6]|uniref:MarR family winged helix-turn-helix transcriptional regulator n=1 Tax=Streptomyces sp. ME19-01-6 TaxID=3028686 RepID=UPI0029A18EA9|nr:MarR family transcriptional regulator [Streptomyces sp. ME19-01-6]MDX3225543.1 MarR family transcriptional regulator [Streptomyces sp. ME19-01-6]